MVKFKLNISNPRDGTAFTREIDEPESLSLIGKRIGDVVDGSLVGLEGVKLRITGGSDRSGFPMRPDVPGGRKVYILSGRGVGVRTIKGKTKKGYRRRVLVRGNTITPEIYQVNMVIVEGSPNEG